MRSLLFVQTLLTLSLCSASDCSSRDFSTADKSEVCGLSVDCLGSLSETSAASLAKNPFTLECVKLKHVRDELLHHFIPLLLESEAFLAIQDAVKSTLDYRGWHLALLAAVDETKVTKTYSDLLNEKIGEKYAVLYADFERILCNERNILPDGNVVPNIDEALSKRCLHHIAKNFSDENFKKVILAFSKEKLRFLFRRDTLQVIADKYCIEEIFEQIYNAFDPRQPSLEKSCESLIKFLIKKMEYQMRKETSLSVTRHKDFQSMFPNLNDVSYFVIREMLPGLSVSQIKNTDAESLKCVIIGDRLNESNFSSPEAYEAFTAKVKQFKDDRFVGIYYKSEEGSDQVGIEPSSDTTTSDTKTSDSKDGGKSSGTERLSISFSFLLLVSSWFIQ